MSWREKMTVASFRGVEFYASSGETGGGRRFAKHEYPKRDVPYVEDLGKQSREISVSGHVIGDDYLAAKDKLILALEEYGPGQLIHPYFGEKTAICSKFTVSESSEEGGIAKFSITFQETESEPKYPTSSDSDAEKIATSSDDVRSYIATYFLENYSPGVLMGSIEDTFRSITLKVDTAKTLSALGPEAAASIRKRIDRLNNSIKSIALEPQDVIDELIDLFDGITGLEAIIDVYSFEASLTPSGDTTNRAIELNNFNAFELLSRVLLIARISELAAEYAYESYEQAVYYRDIIINSINDLITDTDTDTYEALEQLRADIAAAIPGSDENLRHLLDYSVPSAVPSIVLAHGLYGNVDMEQDILGRNKIKKPGFVHGQLKVLSDAF
jgi:prophage DNA circulation protein